MEGLIIGGAYIQSGNLRFKIDWASLIVRSKFTVLLCFTLYVRAIFPVQAPGGLILILEGRFNGGFFALPVWGAYFGGGLIFGGAYKWRGLFLEFYGIRITFSKNMVLDI